jgi:hypothetical protein
MKQISGSLRPVSFTTRWACPTLVGVLIPTRMHRHIEILVYHYIKSTQRPTSKDGWIEVMKQFQTMHTLSNLFMVTCAVAPLPHNLIFSGDDGNVINFDSM